jgi:hypothetical protein
MIEFIHQHSTVFLIVGALLIGLGGAALDIVVFSRLATKTVTRSKLFYLLLLASVVFFTLGISIGLVVFGVWG